MIDEAVTAVVLTTIVPAVMAADVPMEAFVPVGTNTLAPGAVPTVRFPVVVNVPGVIIAFGNDMVAVDPTVVAVTWLAVPNTVCTSPLEDVTCAHVEAKVPCVLV